MLAIRVNSSQLINYASSGSLDLPANAGFKTAFNKSFTSQLNEFSFKGLSTADKFKVGAKWAGALFSLGFNIIANFDEKK